MIQEIATVSFTTEEQEWIQSFAELSGKSFSDQVHEWAVQRLEDELFAHDLIDLC